MTSLKLYCSWKIDNIKSLNGRKRKIKFNGYLLVETNIRRASLTFVSKAKSTLQVLEWVYLFDNFRSKREFFTTFPSIEILNAGLLICFKLYSGKYIDDIKSLNEGDTTQDKTRPQPFCCHIYFCFDVRTRRHWSWRRLFVLVEIYSLLKNTLFAQFILNQNRFYSKEHIFFTLLFDEHACQLFSLATLDLKLSK